MSTDKTVVALGNFDGVHKGHKKVIEKAVKFATERGAIPCAITFDGRKDCIFDLTERIRRLKDLGIKSVYVIEFTQEIKDTPAREFIEKLTEKENVTAYVCGYDFTYGKGAEGNAETLKAFCDEKGIDLSVIDKVDEKGEKVSATAIREMLKNGDIVGANALLTEPYAVFGKVVHGKGLGRTIGFPTANVSPYDNVISVKEGVYKGKVVYGKKTYGCIINYGSKPTVRDDNVSLEVYIKGFKKDIYDKEIRVEFTDRLRDIKKFERLDDLKEQLKKDAESLQ